MSGDQGSSVWSKTMQVLKCPEYLVRSNRLLGNASKVSTTVFVRSTGSLPPNVTPEEYQCLPKSALPTYYFEKSLPKLPVPKLEDTSTRYLEALRPLLTDDEFARTEKLVKSFQEGVGKSLHDKLVAANKQLRGTSYITKPWFDMYLKDRLPLPINSNPALVFVEDESIKSLAANKRQLIRATNLLVSSLRFLHALDREVLGPEVFHLNPKKSDNPRYYKLMNLCPTRVATYASYLFKAFPLDMSQYQSLFRSTRVPQKGMDRLKKGTKDVRHIAVMYKGHIYTCNVLDERGEILPVDVLQGTLEAILNSETEKEKHPIGVMTTQNRDIWAEVRSHMCKSQVNTKSLNAVDTALYVLSLDDVELTDDPVSVIRSFLHSDGTNRWFDKSFNLILSKDAWAGINFEHAWGDGVAVMRFFNEIHDDAIKHKWSNGVDAKSPIEAPTKLAFELDDKSKAAIQEASDRYMAQVRSLDVNPFILEKFGRKACKTWGISPDSLMQLGFQVVHQRLHGKTDTTYESCSTAIFKHGRTEAIRPATMLTKQVSEALASSDWQSNKGSLKQLIKDCSTKHTELTKNAAMGQGFDRHLFALKNIVQQENSSLPELFTDSAYAKINYNILSTSTLGSPAVRIGGFGPVVSDGYGLAYQIWDTGLGCLATTYKGQRDGAAFAKTCEIVFQNIETVMNS